MIFKGFKMERIKMRLVFLYPDFHRIARKSQIKNIFPSEEK